MERQHHATPDGPVDFTDEEQAEYEARNAPSVLEAALAATAKAAHNLPILAALVAVDQKKVRALTDAVLAGDTSRLKALEAEAVALRAQLQ